MKQELAKKEETHMTVADTMRETGIEASDLAIPRLMLMQNTSSWVGEGKAKLGDLVNSQSLEVQGGTDKPVEIVPLKMWKTLRTYDQDQAPPKFIKEDPLTPELQKLPFEGVDKNREGDEVSVRRYINFNFFVLLRKEVSTQESFPLVVSFKSTSLNAGKQLATHIFKMAALKRLPFSQSVNLTVTKDKKENNYYGVLGIAKGSNLSEAEVQEAQKWLTLLSTVSYKVDEDKEEKEAARKQAPPVVVGSTEEAPY